MTDWNGINQKKEELLAALPSSIVDKYDGKISTSYAGAGAYCGYERASVLFTDWCRSAGRKNQ